MEKNSSERNQKENRHRIVYINQIDVFKLFRLTNGPIGRLEVPIFAGDALPADAELVAIHHDYSRDAFAFKLWSATWPTVPEGTKIPEQPDVIYNRITFSSDEVTKIRRRTRQAIGLPATVDAGLGDDQEG